LRSGYSISSEDDVVELKAWATVANLIALLVLIGAFVLALMGRMDATTALMIGGLAVAVVLD